MKIGIGFSSEKDPESAIVQAYREGLKQIKATQADLVLLTFSYDYAVDSEVFSAILKKTLKYVPHIGCSTLGAWTSSQGFQNEPGLFALCLKDMGFDIDYLKVHSLKEKAEVWFAELARQLEDKNKDLSSSSLMLFVDSLNFIEGGGIQRIQERFPGLQVFGLGVSFGIPQCSIIQNGHVFSNSLLGVLLKNTQPHLGIMQSVRPELEPIRINRMSDNLIIEIDQKPAFYRLSEHLVQIDNLPMMSPDQFRKHMGNLYILEKSKLSNKPPKTFGEPYRVVSLLGSEMTTGMVAVADPLDFEREHYLAQRKVSYAEDGAREILAQLKEEVPHPKLILMVDSSVRMKEFGRTKDDLAIVREYFSGCPIFGLSANGELLGELNQFSCLLVVFS